MRLSHALVAIAGTVVMAGGAAPAGRHRHQFKVTMTAAQDVTWTENVPYRPCPNSTVTYAGSGRSALRIRPSKAQPALATRSRGRQPTLTFKGGTAVVPVSGTFSREGSRGPAG